MGVPAVTVIIPAFNAELHIAEALKSVGDQTRRDIEVLVVDDGSTDGTVREAGRFAGELDLTIVRQANAGPAAARNAGIRLARGRHCAFLDADDVMLPERLAAQVELLDTEADLGLVHTDLMTFDERGIIHRTRRAFSDPCGGMALDRLLLDNFITTSTVMAPTDRLIEVGLFGEGRRVSEDFELWLRMAARWRLGFIARPLALYRRRPGSLSDDKLATARCALEVVETFWREHPQHRTSQPRVYQNSIAQHLAIAGAAAYVRGRRGSALSYLVRSLRLDPWRRDSWKSLAKLVIPDRLRPRGGTSMGSPGPDEG
jgi:glycosyltransferase involved in cell wall biosynthesis